MLTCSLSSQSRITCNDPVVVLNVRVTLRRPPRGPGVRTHTVTESFPTSRPATRSNMTSMAPPPLPSGDPRLMASVRRDLCQDTDPRAPSQQSSGNRDPRAIHLNGLARTSVCRRRRPTPHSHQPVQRLEERNRLHLLHEAWRLGIV